MNDRPLRWCALPLLAVLAVGWLAAPGGVAAERPALPLALPAYGLLDLDEGTIEIPLRLNFPPRDVPEAHRGYGPILDFRVGDRAFPGDGLTLSLHSRNGNTYVRTQLSSGGQALSAPLNIGLDRVRAGEWFLLAVLWSREDRELSAYVDGRPAGSRSFLSGLDLDARPTSRAVLTLGPAARDRQTFDLGGVRISRHRRAPEALAGARPLPADERTLLRLLFPVPDEEDSTAPTPVAATPAARAALR